MKLKLKRPIIFFDFESTGVDTNKDRIVQIAVLKVWKDGKTEEKQMLINPEMSIPLGASEVHGITDDMVKDSPKFSQVAKSLNEYFDGCDLAGFNSDSYDVNLLVSEMERAGISFDLENRNFVDVLKLYRELFPNKLTDIYKRLFGKELEGAHDAMVDVLATKEVLEKIIDKTLDTPEKIDYFCQGDKKRVDIAGKMYEDEEGVVRWAFSKNKDMDVKEDRGFANWFLKQDFPQQSKDKLNEILNG